ncbi:MAG TPA: hypothetical protein VN948_10030, partial [Terriglobales bacterium]|nr:hypothetical protein [Terriglobales bacterium]
SADPCHCTPTKSGNNIQTYWTGTPYAGHVIHNSPAYWEYDLVVPNVNYIYAGPANAQLTQYPLCVDTRATGPIDLITCPRASIGSADSLGHPILFSYGVTPSVSANGAGAPDAIVWAISKPDQGMSEGTTPGIFYAFDATTMRELYGSDVCPGDAIAPATKYSVPTVANGFAYVGAQEIHLDGGGHEVNTGLGKFYIFGAGRTC